MTLHHIPSITNSTLLRARSPVRTKVATLLPLFTLILFLSACGVEGIRDDAQIQLRKGNYENALSIYEEGLVRYPDDVVLKSGLVSSRETIFAKLMASAAAARANGNSVLAWQIGERALNINPMDDRAKSLLLDIERDRRQSDAVNQAHQLLAQGLRERASIIIESALKDNPKNAELIALQRQLELEDKQSELLTVRLTETHPISLDFKEANLRMVMDLITRSSGINFVIDKDVRADLRTTVYLKNTPLEDALELITTTNQLTYKVLNSTAVLIYPKTPDKMKDYQDLVIRAFYLSNVDAKQTAALLKSMLKMRDPYVDEKLNMIIVRETPQTIRLAERLIALQDLSEPEVMLEMEVLEVQRSSLTQLGINYPDTLTLTPIVPGVTNLVSGSTSSPSSTTNSGLTLNGLRNLNGDNIGVNTPSVTINFHKNVGDINLLANPKVRARNHEKAKVMVGDKLPVVTATGSANNTGFISESVSYVDVGLKLNVEPTIYLDDEVGIKLGLEVSSLVNTIKTAAGSTVYQIGTRNVDTVLKLHDGETQLLAGLINNSEQMSANRVPGLGDLPVLGRLFSSQSDNGQRSEIVLSITPHIIRNIRRPDINQTEFWSGTENDIRSKPLTLPGMNKPANDSIGKLPAPSTANSMPAAPVALTSPLEGANPSSATQEPDYVLTIQAPKEIVIGQFMTVNVQIKANKPLRGMPIIVQFNKSNLEIINAEDGTFFKSDGSVVSKTKSLEQSEGRVAMSILRNAPNDLSGEGTLISITFKAIAAGAADIHITAAKPIASQPIVPADLPAAITVMVK